MTKLNPVYVEWDDSESQYGWGATISEFPETIKSVGLLVYQDKKMIVLSTSKTEHDKYADQLIIPKCSIRKMRKIRIEWIK